MKDRWFEDDPAADTDCENFRITIWNHIDRLRRAHFPPPRNFLRAHLTMFHRLPGEYMEQILKHLTEVAAANRGITAQVPGLRHLGAGVAFTIASPQVERVHIELRVTFVSWPGGQDLRKWQPHITIQNMVSRSAADALHSTLRMGLRSHPVEIVGLDL
ncbi:2'-5' RNA ligase family protein [Sinorhizobium sp. 7-81]|uniref:2'-5' RNA ligase family protein n=1 Tax=Sinorhizobium sp. 8-89 TaxID=3049089 RepID=UPI0024C24688|nr:2'-5' RNA ligase family protein [Sinorhizobium sp. 8-89]MDK1494339.1 2'-5' RNA ligase family protein [Sinorhizobium sp. 8-89]